MSEIICKPTVKIICDSINRKATSRLTTFELVYWRAIHSELMTHRVFSRNARSSRATPIKVNIEQVRNTPYGPRFWGLNEKGMTATKEASPEQQETFKQYWIDAAKQAADKAEFLMNAGLHKQAVNRLLEPFMPIHTILTATEFDNFFKLRIEKHAQPEMYDLAKAMKDAYDNSTPMILDNDELHLPYITDEEELLFDIDVLPFISAARCARISYKNFDGTSSAKDDLKLAQRLLTDGHLSPFEHIAVSCDYSIDSFDPRLKSNFKDFIQFRKIIEDNE